MVNGWPDIFSCSQTWVPICQNGNFCRLNYIASVFFWHFSWLRVSFFIFFHVVSISPLYAFISDFLLPMFLVIFSTKYLDKFRMNGVSCMLHSFVCQIWKPCGGSFRICKWWWDGNCGSSTILLCITVAHSSVILFSGTISFTFLVQVLAWASCQHHKGSTGFLSFSKCNWT